MDLSKGQDTEGLPEALRFEGNIKMSHTAIQGILAIEFLCLKCLEMCVAL